MKVFKLREEDRIIYMKNNKKYEIKLISDDGILIKENNILIPFSELCDNYKFIKNNGELEDIVNSLDKIEFIANARFLGWICFQMASGQYYNTEPKDHQIDSLKNGVIFGLSNPNATLEENHKSWMNSKLSQGWKYGETYNLENKINPDLIPFDELPQIEKDKDFMDCLMNKKFNKLWDKLFKE